MNRKEYNARVQSIQAALPEAGTRITTFRGADGLITSAYFEVSWDGQWCPLGIQKKPFTDEAAYEWDDYRETLVLAKYAAELVRS